MAAPLRPSKKTDLSHRLIVSSSHRLSVSARVSRLASHVKPRNGSAIAPHQKTDLSYRLIVLSSQLASHVSRLTSNRAMAAPLRPSPKNRFVSASQRLIVSARVSCLASHVKPRNGSAVAPLPKKQICLSVSASYCLSSRLTSRVSRQTAQWQRHCAPPRKHIYLFIARILLDF